VSLVVKELLESQESTASVAALESPAALCGRATNAGDLDVPF
jgi:hypothetical protein